MLVYAWTLIQAENSIMNQQQSIIFGSSMVKAILNGQKSQTRRLLTDNHLQSLQLETKPQKNLSSSPYGKIGDHIWVKEAWRTSEVYDGLKPTEIPKHASIEYRSDLIDGNANVSGKWRTPLFMCRHFSRLSLEITGYSIEYLNDCSEKDAKAEGMLYLFDNNQSSYKDLYKTAWENLHGKSSWDHNPLVWVISFKFQKVWYIAYKGENDQTNLSLFSTVTAMWLVDNIQR